LTAFGIELEGEHEVDNSLSIYGNFSWALNMIDDTAGSVEGINGAFFNVVEDSTYFTDQGQTTGVPEYIWNLGFDYNFTPKHILNIHYRGWAENWGKTDTSPTRFEVYGPEHYVDANFTLNDFYTKGSALQGYVKNLFDNRSPMPQAPHGGDIAGIGIEIGVAVSHCF
jgi:hypothetical protein